MTKITFLLFISIGLANSQQNLWKKVDKNSLTSKQILKTHQTVKPNTFNLYELDLEAFQQQLSKKLEGTTSKIVLPVGDSFTEFNIQESSNFTNPPAAKYGFIKSYTIKGIQDKTATGTMSFGHDGVHINVSSGKHQTILVEPFTKNRSVYMTYRRDNIQHEDSVFECLVSKDLSKAVSRLHYGKSLGIYNNGILKVYRLALSCSVQYATFHINDQGVSSGTDIQKEGAVLSAMNTVVTRLNSIFGRELAIKFKLVLNTSGENELIFISQSDFANTVSSVSINNFTNAVNEDEIRKNDAVCKAVIGSKNYDIAHLLLATGGTGGRGLAYVGVACVNGYKGGGATGMSAPKGETFVVSVLSHELGHQLGANHVHSNNNSCNSEAIYSIGIEPGSGSSIMSYSGICSNNNYQLEAYDYFNAGSIKEILKNSYTQCYQSVSINNSAPVANAGNDVSVPVSTPLILRGEVDAPNGYDGLTYSWEQQDSDVDASMPPLTTNTSGAMFRAYAPTENPNRYLPHLAAVIDPEALPEEYSDPSSMQGLYPRHVNSHKITTWQVLPSVARQMTFSLMVRDNNPGGSGNDIDEMTISFIDTKPFTVQTPTNSDLWESGSVQTVIWDKSTTDQAPINCSHVRIKLSVDGGKTFPHTLVESTPNDGNHTFIVDNFSTETARIMVEAIDNIFYNINPENFVIEGSLSDSKLVFNHFNLFPNPSEGIFNLTFEIAHSETPVTISLFNIRGQRVDYRYFDYANATFEEPLNYKHLHTGLYILQVENGDIRVLRKLMIK